MNRRGFPHSEIFGSMPVCDSPKLIAAYRVLLRLLAPRHPPYALSSLTTRFTRNTNCVPSILEVKLSKALLCNTWLTCFSCPYLIQLSKNRCPSCGFREPC